MTKSFAIKCEFSCFVVTAVKGGLNATIFAVKIYFLFLSPNKFDEFSSEMHYFSAIILFLSLMIKIILKFIYKIVNGTQITFLVQ